MTTQVRSFLTCLCLLISIAAFAQTDLEAIKTVIGKETQSFMNVDRKNWAENWHPAPYSYWSYSDSTGTSFVEGWEALNKTFDEYFKTQKPSKAKITNEWIEVRIYGNGAYARFVQKVDDEIDRDETSQIRVLEKKEGKWKVVCVGAIAKYSK